MYAKIHTFTSIYVIPSNSFSNISKSLNKIVLDGIISPFGILVVSDHHADMLYILNPDGNVIYEYRVFVCVCVEYPILSRNYGAIHQVAATCV